MPKDLFLDQIHESNLDAKGLSSIMMEWNNALLYQAEVKARSVLRKGCQWTQSNLRNTKYNRDMSTKKNAKGLSLDLDS